MDAPARVLVLSESGGLGAALVQELDEAGARGEIVIPGSDTSVCLSGNRERVPGDAATARVRVRQSQMSIGRGTVTIAFHPRVR